MLWAVKVWAKMIWKNVLEDGNFTKTLITFLAKAL